MNRIVLTGANGFVGSALAKKLHDNGNDVICLIRKNSNTNLIEHKSTIRQIDYSDIDSLESVIRNADIFIHIAALTRARKWDTFKKNNIDLTNKLLQICNKHSIKQFILLSSQAVAGPALNEGRAKKEKDFPNPVTMYGKSKLVAEELVQKNSENPWTIIRPVSVYGAGDKDFLKLFKMVKNHIVFINSFKTKSYNLIHIDELTEIIEQIILNKNAFNEILFAAHPKKIKNIELHKLIGKAINSKTITVRIPEFMLSPIASFMEFLSFIFRRNFPILNRDKVKEFKEDHWIVDTSKTSKKLEIEFEDEYINNFNKTYEWYKNKGWL